MRLFLLACLAGPVMGAAETTVLSTDVFEVTFSVDGGVPVRWSVVDARGEPPVRELLDPDVVSAVSFRPFSVVTDDGSSIDRRVHGLSRSREGDRTTLVFTSPVAESGLRIVKTYEFSRASHVFSLRVDLENEGTERIEIGSDGTGPGITVGPGLGYSQARRPELFEGIWAAAIRPLFDTGEGAFSVAPEAEAPGDRQVSWGGLHSPFFTAVVIPESAFTRARIRSLTPDELAGVPGVEADAASYPCLVLFNEQRSLAPGESASLVYRIYAGPKDPALLREAGHDLESILFHHLWGWLAELCRGMQFLLSALNGIFGSWGLSILAFAALFRLVTLPLSLYGARNQMHMQAVMADLNPAIAAAKKEHGKDSAALNDAIVALYRQHGVGPISHFKGCLPLLVQLPVLIAFFQLLLSSNELRNVSFLWIDDLMLADRLFPLGISLPWLGAHFNLLPVLMLGAQVLVARSMSSRRPGAASSRAIYVLPVTMTILFYPFPAGCMLFWTTGNVLQVFEQWWLCRIAEDPH